MHTDVLIVGAGPTGLLLANLLGKMNVPTVVVERNKSTVNAPRAVSIDDESMRSLQAAGLGGEFLKIVQKGYGSIYRDPSGRVFATVKPISKVYGFEKRNAFQQPELEALLKEGLSRFPGMRPLFETELASFSQTDERVDATLIAKGIKHSVSAKYMVACDGGRSTVRKQLGIPMQGSSFKEPWLIVDLKSTRNRNFHTEVFCNPERPCITLPGPGGVRRYEFKLGKGEIREDAEQESFARKLLARFGPDENEPLRRVQVYTFQARTAAQWRQGRIYLAGDAAHLTPPFAGQGLNSGLRDASNLAWKLAEALVGKPTDSFLDSYEAERKPHAKSMIKLAERMGAVMMPTSRLQGALVRAAFRCLGLFPPAREYFAQMKFKPKPKFVSGLVVKDGRPQAWTIVGSLFPQPLVELPDGTTHLIDDLLPDRPVILAYAERPEAFLSESKIDEFAELGASVFGVTPEWTKALDAGFPTGRDANRLLATKEFLTYLDYAMLLRRDRYVAAAAPLYRLDELRDAVRLIRSTENRQPSQCPSAATRPLEKIF